MSGDKRVSGFYFLVPGFIALAITLGAASPRSTMIPTVSAQEASEIDPFDPEVVHELRMVFEDENWERQLSSNAGANRDIAASLELDGAPFAQVGVRYKGRSSLDVNSSKKPFNITLDAYEAGQDAGGYDILNLSNHWGDPSMLREMLSYELMRPYMPVPHVAYARVYAQDRYLGLYLLVEQIDGGFAREHFGGDEGVRIKGEPPDLELSQDKYPILDWRGEGLAPYRQTYSVKGSPDDPDAVLEELKELTRVLDAPTSAGGVSDEEFLDAIRETLDVDEVLWYLAAHNILASFDSYYFGHNYYLMKAATDQRFHIVSWDLNLSLWGFPFGETSGNPYLPNDIIRASPFLEIKPVSFFFIFNLTGDRPLIDRLLAIPELRADYAAHYRTLRDQAFAPESLEPRVRAWHRLIDDAVREENEEDALYGYDAYQRNLESDIFIQFDGRGFSSHDTVGVLRFVQERFAWLSDPSANPELISPNLNLLSRNHSPLEPTLNDQISFSAAFDGLPESVSLHYRIDQGMPQIVPMQAGEDRIWQATTPATGRRATLTWYLRAALPDGRSAFFPPNNSGEPWALEISGVQLPIAAPGNLVLNELQARNPEGARDEQGEAEDWIELYNRGDQSIALTGLFLSDRPEDPWKYALPSLELRPGQHLLVWADGQPEQGTLHAPFRLDSKGETLVLASNEQILDRIEFQKLPAGFSYGRAKDGAAIWNACQKPSPLAANLCEGLPSPTIYLPVLALDE